MVVKSVLKLCACNTPSCKFGYLYRLHETSYTVAIVISAVSLCIYRYRQRRGTIDCKDSSCKKSILCSLRTSQSGDSSHCGNVTEAYRYYYNHKSC